MVIVGGSFTVEPAQRDEFLVERLDMMRVSRQHAGCLEYTFAADPLDSGRVILFERWEDQASLDAHLAALRGDPATKQTIKPTGASVTIYDVASERSL